MLPAAYASGKVEDCPAAKQSVRIFAKHFGSQATERAPSAEITRIFIAGSQGQKLHAGEPCPVNVSRTTTSFRAKNIKTK
ncbi:hypothetical protein E4U53_004390 [Claviceps sorghi]|nr:hypothetical protein E4U53_004390 [Claviceps sorghi]